MSTCSIKEYGEQPILTFLFNVLQYSCSQGSKIFYIYGGAPRDLLRGQEPKDYDIFVKDERNITNFLSFLKCSNRLKKETRNVTQAIDYKALTVEIELNGQIVFLDITNETTASENGILACDFTCNNLILDRTGLSTRVNCPASLDLSSPLWLLRCIQDSLEGKLSWIVSDDVFKNIGSKRYLELRRVYQHRLQKMKDKGFGGEIFLTSFQNKPFNIVPSSLQSDGVCIICKEGYSDREDNSRKKDVIVLDCSHHFHIDCLDDWIKQGRYKSTCPLCRKTISWL
jgi:hypothetical protein